MRVLISLFNLGAFSSSASFFRLAFKPLRIALSISYKNRDITFESINSVFASLIIGSISAIGILFN